MVSEYFSDRDRGAVTRTVEEIDARVWGGLVALYTSLLSDNSLAIDYAEACPDGAGPSGTDTGSLGLALAAEVPNIDIPLRADEVPETYDVLDFLEFCHSHVADPARGRWHDFFSHHHLSFDREAGQAQFRRRVNRILQRNRLAFTLDEEGRVTRIAPPAVATLLSSVTFRSGDDDLDGLLDAAVTKFSSVRLEDRRDGLEKLWDGFERMKTVLDPADKRRSSELLLSLAAGSEADLLARFNSEARELTDIGNSFQIRHFETGKVPLTRSHDVDYLFYRCFSFVFRLYQALLTRP